MRLARIVPIALASALLAACVSPTDPLGRVDALEEVQKRYTEAIRWGDLEKASRYVASDMREDFLALADAFEDIRFTDYEIGELDVDTEDLGRAEVVVSYRGYVMPQYLERRADDHQVWVREGKVGNDWRVQPQLALLIDEISGRTAR